MQAVQEQLVSSFICGATGACCTASNTYPHLYRQIFDMMTSNRIAEAYEVQSKIRRWLLLYKQANSAKHVLNRLLKKFCRASTKRRKSQNLPRNGT